MFLGNKRRVGLFLSGKPVLIQELNILLTPPTIADIVMYGEDDFLLATQLIVHTEQFLEEIKQGNSELNIFSNFQLLMTLIREDKNISSIIENYFEFIFPDYQIDFQDGYIDFKIIQGEKKKIISRLNPFNYDLVKDMIDTLFLNHTLTMETQIDYNPANETAKKIADQIKAGRKKTQELKSEKGKDQSMFGQICSSLSIGMQMDLNIFFQYTPFQLYDIYSRFFLKQSYDFYQKVSTTPLMDVSKMETPDEWTKFNY